MKNLFILLALSVSIQSLCQERKDSLNTTKLNDIDYFIKNNPFKINTLKNSLDKIPHNKKIDVFNSNYPTYNYDIYNPNKSNSVINFVLSGITNLF